jgi:BirA family biotin operon repressor/biotin-[acetyl-CoA-carboxylase] ligase
MAALARAGAPEGSWLRADVQQGGRGRHGRPWVSPAGNLYASTLVRPWPGNPPPHTLAMVAAVALDELLQAFVDPARLRIKWPNDLLVGGAKISGILLEAVDDAVVVGIGVNLAHHPDNIDRAATSLAGSGLRCRNLPISSPTLRRRSRPGSRAGGVRGSVSSCAAGSNARTRSVPR